MNATRTSLGEKLSRWRRGIALACRWRHDGASIRGRKRGLSPVIVPVIVLRALVFLAAAGACGEAAALTCNSVASGNWNNNATWSCVATPGANDDVTISASHTVSLNGNNRNSRSFTIAATGQLNDTGRRLTINNNGNVVINGTWSGAGGGRLRKNGTGTLSGGGSITGDVRLEIRGNTTILAGTNLTFTDATNGRIDISGSIVVTNNGTVTVARVTGGNGASTWTNAANSTLNVLSDLLTTGTLNASASGNTVNYSGAAQTVRNPTGSTYHHLTLSGSGAKTMPAAALAIGGNFTMSGTASATAAGVLTVTGNFVLGGGTTFDASTFGHLLAGNFTNNGATFTPSTSTVTLNGGAAQVIGGTTSTTFNNLTINSAGVSLSSVNATVGSVLTLTSGVVTTGANTLITTANCPGSISRTSGHIAGNLQLRFNTGAQTCTFHVGDSAAANYTPVAVTFTNVSTAGSLIGSTTAGDFSDPASPINSGLSVNRFWTLTLPGAGAVAFTGTYGTAFTYLVADNDAGTTPSLYVIAKGDACAPGCTWTLPTVSGTPTNTTATATGMTSFSNFAIGHRKISSFLITVPASPVSTCTAQPISITARDASNATITNYTGLVSITTSSSHGDWSINAANGTLDNGTADDGAATYQFVAADNGSITLNLTNTHADNLTITVNDSAAGVSSTSATLSFSGNAFAITNDTIQVAGRPQAMSVQMNKGSTCAVAVAGYSGSKTLKASITRNADDPGGTAPTISAVSLPNSPSTANVTLTFTSGVANFNLGTTDVGKYVLNLLDDSRTFATGADISGSSPTITTRPFALAISAISQGATSNPEGTATTGSKFIAAADTFQATVGAYLWNSAADTSPADGVPDAAATLAQVTANGATPSYKWATTLSVASPFTPASGTLGTLSNGALVAANFTNGIATPNNLSYNEVGSFTLTGVASNFLNSGITLNAIIFNSSGSQSGVVGRFFPDHFTLLAGSSITPACGGASGFTYMGQPNLGYGFDVEARNVSNVKTSNYRGADYTTGTVSVLAENNNDGTDLSSRLPAPTGSWSAGTYSFSTTTATFSRPAAAEGPFDLLRIGVKVTDGDGPVLASRDMDPVTNTDCTLVPTCTGIQLGGATTKARFGRLRLGNAHGSELLDLPLPVKAEYYDGNFFVTNTLDSCTTLSASDIVFSFLAATPNLIACETQLNPSGAIAFASGRAAVRLTKPGNTNNGAVDLTVNLGAAASGNTCTSAASSAATAANKTWLQGNWGSGSYNENPRARATFGIFKNADQFLYLREVY